MIWSSTWKTQLRKPYTVGPAGPAGPAWLGLIAKTKPRRPEKRTPRKQMNWGIQGRVKSEKKPNIQRTKRNRNSPELRQESFQKP